jgi:hypothetical protein
MEKSGKIRKIYTCDKCDYHTCESKDYKKHLVTRKHIGNESAMICPEKSGKSGHPKQKYTCEICNKSYCDSSGLWRHKKTCNAKEGELKNEMSPSTSGNAIPVITADMFMELMRQNKEFQSIMMEGLKIVTENMSKSSQGNTNNINTENSNNINSHNSFNLSFFLNEQCKNAININQFVDSLNPTLQDVERTGKVGFVEGITGIILNGLRELDVYTRPIHCTDLKRDVLYVKDNDKWEKEEDDKPLFRKAVKRTANKNFKQIRAWEQQHPDYTDTDTRASDEHVALCQKLMGGMTPDESEKLENSIMKNVLKKVTIDKEALTV